MPDLSSYKIPVVLGVNDAPVPPNFQDNGLGCNGAFFIEKYNSLIDDIGSQLTYQAVASSITVDTWVIYGVDTALGELTLTLPTANSGDYAIFIDRTGSFGTNNLTINPGVGDTIAGADGLVLNHNQECVTLLYDAGVNNWIIKEALVLGGLDNSAPNMSKVIVSSNDTTAGTLSEKVVAGSNITLSRLNPGGYEQLRITATTGDAHRIVNGTSEVTIPNADGSIQLKVNDLSVGALTSDSVFIGNLAGLSAVNTEGNVGIGEGAAASLSTGIKNTLIGSDAGGGITAGAGNVSVGKSAGASVTIGENNVYIGGLAGDTSVANPHNLLSGSLTGSNNLVLGYGAMPSAVGSSNEIVIGNGNHSVIRSNVTSITSLSDGRDKADIKPLTLGLDFINSLNPVTYKWDKRDWYKEGSPKDGSLKQEHLNVGFIAQDLQRAQEEHDAQYMQLVFEANPERLEVTTGNLICSLVKAVQELSQELSLVKEQLNSD